MALQSRSICWPFKKFSARRRLPPTVANLLNSLYGAAVYAYGTLNGASSGAGTQGVVYNTQTLQLLDEATVGTASLSGAPRQTLRHHFQPIGGGPNTDFYLYNSHWKAADDAEGRNRRWIEAQAIRDDADLLANGTSILYVGDFNLYDSNELAFQEIIGAGNGQAFDPINRLGNWSNQASFVDVFTQAPSNSPPPGLTSGGLDDRFDFQLISGELTDGFGIEYRGGSYHTFGNNGSVSMNGSINDSSNNALPGLSNRLTVLNLLTTVSDHLPVVADYTFASSVIVNQAPASNDATITLNENTEYTFSVADFGFSDPNNTPANIFDSVKISTLPAAGALTLDGFPVAAGQFITASSLNAGSLKFTPAVNASGLPYTTFSFQVRDNGGTLNGGYDLDPTPNVFTINVNPVVIPAIRINEALINPSDLDDSREFVELIRLTSNETLSNVWLLELETDATTGRGIVDMALNLGAASFGSNDLLLIGDNYTTSIPYSVPNATALFNLNRPGFPSIENSANLLLVYDFTGSVGMDYDSDDDGILDSTPWVTVIDAVSLVAGTEAMYVPGTRVSNANGQDVVDAVVRFSGNTAASTSAAFYGGRILDTGNALNDLAFQASPGRSSNFPVGGVLTPGMPNVPSTDSLPPTVTDIIAVGSAWSGALVDAVDGGGVGAGNGLGYSLTSGLTLPNAGIDRIYIQFSEPVIGFDESTFALFGVNVPDYSMAPGMYDVSFDSLNNRGVIQLSPSIITDKLRIGISDTLTDASFNALDGDNNTLAGGVLDFQFNVLIGDASNDGSVNGGDLSFFAGSFNQSVGNSGFDPRADWNSDGSVNGGDLSLFAAFFNQSLPLSEPAAYPSLALMAASSYAPLIDDIDAWFSLLDDEEEWSLLDG